MVYSQNTVRLGSYQTKSAINLQNRSCEMNASYSPHTHTLIVPLGAEGMNV